MKTLLFTIIIFGLAIFGLAIGYIIKRKTLKGSCGGLAAMGIDRACDCKEPCGKCDEPGDKKALQQSSNDKFYDANPKVKTDDDK